MDIQRERERLLQIKSIEKLQYSINALDLVTIYMMEPFEEKTNRSIYGVLIPSDQIEQALSDVAWDLCYENGHPSITKYYQDGEEHVKYLRFGNDNGVEPLVIDREFHGILDNYVEIAEEFRLFHNLYHDRKQGQYIKIDNAGEEHVVATVEPNQVKIRMKEIRQFLTIKEKYLLIQFDYQECTTYTIEELGLSKDENDQQRRGGLYCWNLSYTEILESIGEKGTISRLLGKHLIKPFPKSKSGIWGFSEEPKKYESFIIGVDDNGDEITYTCDPDALANYFGKNRAAPKYLTPVSFNKDVLDRYYNRPRKYKVEDGVLRCGSLWNIFIDNHHDDKVCAWLGDIGRSLPYREQRHWRTYNIPSTTDVSKIYRRRQLFCVATDSNRPEHVFQIRYQKLLETCQNHLGWQLLLPLERNDQYHLQNIRVPSSNEQPNFDGLVLSLTKILIDSLNEKKLKELIPDEDCQHRGSISRLEAILNDRKASDASYHIEFLRKLQNLRSSGSSHRKGNNYEKALSHFKAESDDFKIVFEKILLESITFFDYLIDLVDRGQFRETQ